MIQVHDDAVKIVGPKGAVRAPRLPVGTKHEVIHHKLASTLKQLSQGYLSTRPIKDIILLYLDPGQFPALATQLLAETGKLFFSDQKLFSRLEPFVQRNDFVVIQVCSGHIGISVVREVFFSAHLEAFSTSGPLGSRNNRLLNKGNL